MKSFLYSTYIKPSSLAYFIILFIKSLLVLNYFMEYIGNSQTLLNNLVNSE